MNSDKIKSPHLFNVCLKNDLRHEVLKCPYSLLNNYRSVQHYFIYNILIFLLTDLGKIFAIRFSNKLPIIAP